MTRTGFTYAARNELANHWRVLVSPGSMQHYHDNMHAQDIEVAIGMRPEPGNEKRIHRSFRGFNHEV